MSTIKELKEWLNRFPEDTIIKVGIQEEPTGYESYGRVNFSEMKLENTDCGDGWEYVDFTENSLIKSDSKLYAKKYLFFGEGK